MTFPLKFDSNEWFILASLFISIVIFIVLPKRFPHTLTILILLYCMFVPKLLDTIIGTKPFDFYDINDSPKYEIFDLLTWFTYIPFGYFFLYFYDKWHVTGFMILIYVVTWSGLAVGIEWLALKMDVFTFLKWQSIYSLPMYLVVQCSYILFFLQIKRFFFKTNIQVV